MIEKNKQKFRDNMVNMPDIMTVEQAILTGQNTEDLKELARLADTAGVKVLGEILHRSEKINPAYYLGTGKLEELKLAAEAQGANLIIFDNDLSPAQHRNLEEFLEKKVVDRTQLILDIFAQHAHTRESKLQVELAQLEYLLPKLSGRGIELSRLGGGIGTRGPGETKLEVDRRRIQTRIHKLETALKDIRRNREVQRKSRNDPIIALVGYTNAGKSTLMNLLTEAGTLVADQLFATLDSTLRQIILPIGRKVIITDTVGFIKKLPHQLVASFSATLEEIKNADILLHIIDGSHQDFEDQIKVVEGVLSELDLLSKELIPVFNKIDLISNEEKLELELRYPEAVTVSARTGEGKENLLERVSKIILEGMVTVILKIPYAQAHLIDQLHQQGEVFREEYQNNIIEVEARVPDIVAKKLKEYVV